MMDKIDREIDEAREDKEFQERLRRRHEANKTLYALLALHDVVQVNVDVL